MFAEPHLRPGGFRADPSEALPGALPEKTGEEEALAHGIWEEPALREAARAAGGPSYAGWLAAGVARTGLARSWAITALLALVAGPWAILATFLQGGAGSGGFGLVLLVVVGPLVEEVLKISAALMAVERRPYLFKSGAQILAGALASGLVFAAIENVIYLKVYVSDPPATLVAWRWSVCVALHAGCSLVAGLGVRKVWMTSMREGSRPSPPLASGYLTLAALIHGAYNLFAAASDKLFSR